MAITINHQTNDISATSGSLTIDGAAVGGGGSLSAASISGASQTVDFSAADIFVSTADQAVTYTFTNPSPVDKIDLIIDYQVTGGFTLEYVEYTGKSFAFGGQDATPMGFFFKPDGLKMYMLGNQFDRVYQYSLSTAWDVSTAAYDNVSFIVTSQESSPSALFFKPDGTKMYVTGNSGDEVNEYNISVAWDISTASYSTVFSVAAQETNPSGLFFKPDGTKMYIIGDSEDRVFQYSLSTAWLVSSASYEAQGPVVEDGIPTGLFFDPTGSKLFVVGLIDDRAVQYSLATPWDITTATQTGIEVGVAAQDTNPTDIFFGDDGKSLYVLGNGKDRVFQYDSNDGPILTFPSALELPVLNRSPSKKFALTIVTTDSGTSFQVVSQSGPIS